MNRDLGDFQTPPALVASILERLAPVGERWSRVLEPTCGCGNFISGLLALRPSPREIQAIEIQDVHFEAARGLTQQSSSSEVAIHRANLFDLDLRRSLSWRERGPLLVVGNPPWVTNSELGSLGSDNVPHKRNLKGLPGIDALTGAANFDIAEYIWIKLIKELADEHPTIALLCKTLVARNVLQFASDSGLPVTSASIHKIDAKRWFGAAVDACLFVVDLGDGRPQYEADVYGDLRADHPDSRIGLEEGRLVADMEAYRRCSFIDGSSPMTWRQGLKHDAASIFELVCDASGAFRNKLGQTVTVEPDYVYPLVKSSDLFRQAKMRPRKYVIVPQRHLAEDTRQLQRDAPALWNYLTGHADELGRRKSSVYRNQPPFSVFGIGDYSFAPYKVGISGLYKYPRFRTIGPMSGRPVMLDDTGYFIACYCREQAVLAASLLNDPLCLDFIHSLVFWDAKRPITKRVLQRINLRALLGRVPKESLLARAHRESQELEPITTGSPIEWPPSLEELLSERIAEPSPARQMTFGWEGVSA